MKGAIARRTPPPDAELAIFLIGRVAVQSFDYHLASPHEVVRVTELRDQLLQHAVVVGDVLDRELAQLLARIALEHETHATELVDLVELRRHLAFGLVPVCAELVDHRVQHHTVSLLAVAKALSLDGVLGEHIEASPFEFLAYSQQRRLEIATSDRSRDLRTGSRHRNTRERGFLFYGAYPCRSNSDRFDRQTIEGAAQLAPLAVGEALGRHVFHLPGFIGGLHRQRRKRQYGQEPKTETN